MTNQPPHVFQQYAATLNPSSSSLSSSSPSPANDNEADDFVPPKRQKCVPSQEETISLLTFNVLADHLCRPHWFPYCAKEDLLWETRKELIKRTILSAHASIVCLQEVQTYVGPSRLQSNENHLEWFDSWLRENHYSGVFGSRMTYAKKEIPGIQIGNLVYFKNDTFVPIRTERNVSLVATLHAHGDKETKKLYCHSGIRGTVASFIALECRASKRRILVVTTHLPAPRSDTDYSSALEQLLHGIALLLEIATFCQSTLVDCILCAGDLNSMPGNLVCTLFAQGKLTVRMVKRVLRLAEQSKFPPGFSTPAGEVVIPGIRLRGEPQPPTTTTYFTNASPLLPFTNKTNKFEGWIDHVFFLASQNVVLRHAGFDASQNYREGLLPNPSLGFGSDHLPVYCEFVLSACTSEEETTEWICLPPPLEEEEEATAVEHKEFEYQIMNDALWEEISSSPVFLIKLFGDLSRVKKPLDTSTLLAIKSLTSSQVLIVDLKSHEWFARIHPILQNPLITKVTFDCRMDSDVLMHLLECKLTNVLDLQVLHQAMQFQVDASFHIKEATQSWFPFLPNLERVKQMWLSQADLEVLKRAKPPSHINLKLLANPSVLEYFTNQVMSFEYLLKAMKLRTNLSHELLRCVELHSTVNVHKFRQLECEVDINKQKKLILEEVSIKTLVPDMSESSGLFLKQWDAHGLVASEDAI